MNSKKGLTKKVLASVAALAMTAGALQPGFLASTENVVKAAGSDNYAKLLQQSLYFYDANMCGKNDDCLMEWRGSCHTSDEVPGGYHDAGDHVMFGGPQGYTASTLGWSYYEFKDAYDALGQTNHFKTVMAHFTEFFKASTKLDGSGNVTSFLYQKGEGGADHAYWGPPENQTGNRKMYWTSSSAADIAAEYAAALALNYINFKNEEDLKYAKALYSYSTRVNAVATEGVGGFYDNKSANDEQAWAAGWLYLATNQENYKNDCASKQDQYLGWVHGWENTALGAACVYAHITGDWSKVNGWIGGKATGSNYFFLDKWGSARLNCSMQFTALVASKNSSADYTSWCKGQMDYILGNNPANTCFVVGFANNSASKPHHRACSGTSTSEDNSPSKYVLVGALVGGPTDAGGSYKDDRNDYICNEVALDYNAGLVGAAAGLYSSYKTGSLESSIVGAKASNSTPGTVTPTTTPAQSQQTQPSVSQTTPTTTPGNSNPPSSSSKGVYTMKVGDSYSQDEMKDEGMAGWEYALIGVPAGEKVTKVEVKISSSGKLGTVQGAFGTSTTDASSADPYWAMSKDFDESFSSNSGTLTWNVPSDISSIIQTQYKGNIKVGIWWTDAWSTGNKVTIDSVTVYTDAAGSSSGSTVTNPPATTTKPTSSAGTPSTSNGGYTMKVGDSYSQDEMKDEGMAGWEYALIGVPAGEKVTKVEVKISSSGKLGTVQGAFGTSTTDASSADPYWAMSKDFEESFTSNSGTLTWNVPSDISSIIQTQYKGNIKVGIWWADAWSTGNKVTIDSVTVYTDAKGSSTPVTTPATTPVTTTKPTTTTTKPVTTPGSTTSNLKGDCDANGTVNATDIVFMMQSMVGKKTLNDAGIKNADMNNDGKITIVDLVLLKNKLIG